MKIIIEGPNGTGKSTFIEKLLRIEAFSGFEIEHTSQYSPNDFKFHSNMINMPQDMVFDRFYVGETIYPILHKRDALMTKSNYESLYRDNKDTFVVFIDADYSFICKALKERGEEIDQDFINFEKVEFYKAYEALKSIDPYRVFRIKNHLKGPYKFEGTDSVDFVIENLLLNLDKLRFSDK